MSKLPPLPGHPEPHTHCWTSEEIAAIKEYGQQCRDAALDVLRSVKQEVETRLVIGDEIGMRDGLTQILKQLDEALGITT